MVNLQDPRILRNIKPRGFHYPFSKRKDGFPSSDGPPDIFVSTIKQILITNIGERVMRPTFGSALLGYLFASVDDPSIESSIKQTVAESIALWEPRVMNVQVDAKVTESKILVKVMFLSPLGSGEVDLSIARK